MAADTTSGRVAGYLAASRQAVATCRSCSSVRSVRVRSPRRVSITSRLPTKAPMAPLAAMRAWELASLMSVPAFQLAPSKAVHRAW